VKVCYSIDCTGDCRIGDEIKFEKAVFKGDWRNPAFSHLETIEGKIVKIGKGPKTGQLTFTVETSSGHLRIRARNLYRNGVFRKKWDDENAR